MKPTHRLLTLLREVAIATGVSTAAILGPSRKAKVAMARFIFCHISQHVASQSQIGEFLRRDRTTISHATNTMREILAFDPSSPTARMVHELSLPYLNTIQPPQTKPTTMQIRPSNPDHKLNVELVAEAARRVTALLNQITATPGVTDIEMLTLFRETAAHCASHYTGLRVQRRQLGLEPDPHLNCLGLDAWISMAETGALPDPAPQYPPRRQPAVA